MEVIQYHDVLTDKQLTFLSNDKNLQYSASGVYSEQISGNNIHNNWKVGVSSNALLDLTSSSESASIAKLMDRMTGLSMMKSPKPVMRVESYSPGGHYMPRNDFVSASLLLISRPKTSVLFPLKICLQLLLSVWLLRRWPGCRYSNVDVLCKSNRKSKYGHSLL